MRIFKSEAEARAAGFLTSARYASRIETVDGAHRVVERGIIRTPLEAQLFDALEACRRHIARDPDADDMAKCLDKADDAIKAFTEEN